MIKIPAQIKLFAFDLDGTLYVGENTVPGAVELIQDLREKYQLVFFTNNSSKTRSEVHDKLNNLGILCEVEEVYASSTATALYLKEVGIDNVFVIGSCGFRRELGINGVRIVEDETADNIVVGYDADINYRKITTALSILFKGGKFIACNEDGSFPVGEDRFLPGCGAMVGAIVGASGKRPDFIVGKPNTYILSKISSVFGVENNEVMVVGDSYESDIQMALNFNSSSIFIGSEQRLKNDNVQVVENLNQLLYYIREQ